MGKVVKTIVGVGLAIVGAVVPGMQWLVPIGLGIALSDYLVPEIPDATGNEASNGRLGRNVDPEARRKIVFGKTLAGMDQRYWEETNSEQEYHEVLAHATHKINAVGNMWIDGQIVTFNGNGELTAPSELVMKDKLPFNLGASLPLRKGAVIRKTILEGTASNGVAVGSGTYWTAAQSTFTGCAYSVLYWAYDEDTLPRGIPQKIKQELEGALVYDPRKDSTRGGSGTHRADDQTTWEYSPLDSNGEPIGRNNALQVLWYLIGWKIEGVRVAGMGVDLEDIDFASFIEAANNCETMEWYSDGILSTGDQHKKNLGILSSAAGGVVTDTGGIYNYRVALDDTADIVVALDENDIISEITGSPRRPMSEQFNEVAATYVDPRLGYQKVPLPLMEDATYTADDGFTRRKSMSLDMVQDDEQGQKLTRLYLNKGRMQAEFTATFTRKAARVVNMDCITITFADWGWTNRLFRVTQSTYDPQGGITLTFREEDASVYSFGTITPLPAPSTTGGGNPHAKYSVATLSATPTTFTSVVSTVSGEVKTDGIVLTYDQPPKQVTQTQFRLRVIDGSAATPELATNWELLSPAANDTETPSLEIRNLLSLTDYGMQARHINLSGVKGDWSAEVLFTTGGDAIALKAVEAEDPTLRRRTEWLTAATYNVIRDPLFKLGPGDLWRKDDTTLLAFLDANELDDTDRRIRVDISGAKTVNLTYQNQMPVTVGDRLEFSGEFSRETTGVVTAQPYIDWYNSSGTLLSSSGLGALDSGFTQDGGFAEAPANAHRCALRIEITTTGDGSFLMRKPFWRVADPGQTVLTTFDEGSADDVNEILTTRQVQARQASASQVLEVADADKSARIDTEVQARIDGDEAEATARTALEARVTTAENDIDVNEAAITTEQSARASADSAIASDVTALDARVTTTEGGISTNAAAITSEATARASADSAIASDVTALDARVTTNEGDVSTNAAAITSEATARATADSALASDITNLTATVGTNTSGVSTNSTAIADIEGAAAYYSVEVAATGSTNAGAYLTAGETGSRVDLIADKLLFLNYDGTGGVIEAMRIEGGDVKIKRDLQLDSTDGAVSQTFGASGEARFGSLGSGKYGLLVKDASGTEKVRADQDGVEINGANWSTTVDDTGTRPEDNATQSRVFRQATAPSSPTTNDIWYDTDDAQRRVYKWSGTVWEVIATYGASWVNDVTNRPTELTDGRIPAGLDINGDVIRSLTSAVLTGSNILTRGGGGGNYVGALDANNITNTNELTDGANLGGTAAWTGVASRPANLVSLTGTEGINNAAIAVNTVTGALEGIGTGNGTVIANTQISLSSSGVLSGGGTSVQVDATLITNGVADAGATAGAIWTGAGANISAIPSNLSALTGSESIENADITIDVSGILQGIGTASKTVDNQQVTVNATTGVLEGIGTGSVVVNNQKITVDGSGVLQGIGTASKTVDNQQVTVDGSGILQGIGTGSVVVNNANIVASNIPSLDASKITTGTFGTARIQSNAITDDKVSSTAAIKNYKIEYPKKTDTLTSDTTITTTKVSTLEISFTDVGTTNFVFFTGTDLRFEQSGTDQSQNDTDTMEWELRESNTSGSLIGNIIASGTILFEELLGVNLADTNDFHNQVLKDGPYSLSLTGTVYVALILKMTAGEGYLEGSAAPKATLQATGFGDLR